MCLLSLPRHHHWLSCSCNCVSSACGAAAENVGDAGEDAGAAVVETAAGQADAGEAAEDEEEEDQANDEPDPPHQPTFSSHTWDRVERYSSNDHDMIIPTYPCVLSQCDINSTQSLSITHSPPHTWSPAFLISWPVQHQWSYLDIQLFIPGSTSRAYLEDDGSKGITL